MSYQKYLKKGREYLKNNPMVPWIIAGLVVLFLLNPGAMSSIVATDSCIEAVPGETVTIKFLVVNDAAEWVGTSANIVQDEQGYGGANVRVWSGTVSSQAYVEADYKVPSSPGTYAVKYVLSFSGHDTSYTRVTFNVEEPYVEPIPDPVDPVDPVDPADDPVVVLGEMSIIDRVLLMFDLLYQWIDSMLGGMSV